MSDFWGKLVFAGMLFFLICAFQDKSCQKQRNDIPCEMMSDVQEQNSNALIISEVQVPSFQNDYLTVQRRNYVSPTNDAYKVMTDNNKINQALFYLQKMRLAIKPDTAFLFYYHLFSEKSEDSPVLS